MEGQEDKYILSYFSKEQKYIISRKLRGESYGTICKNWPFKDIQISKNSPKQKKADVMLYNQNIISCIRRSAMGYVWSKGMAGGAEMYLCPEDLENLKIMICSAARDGSPYDTSIMITKAYELKIARYSFAVDFLQAVHVESLIEEFNEKRIHERMPVRSWINGVLEDLMASIKTTRFVDVLRIIACTPENIDSYFDLLSEIIERFHPYLIFGADETMLFPSIKRRVVLPSNMRSEFITAQTTLPHFSAMCTHNLFGRSLANFIILPNLKNLPSEIKDFAERGDATFSSSKSGWETKETFLFWTICFINELSVYRQDLPEELREKEALLIMDGHTSRENAFAIQLLKDANVEVLIIPSHTSHVLQMFDVTLASPLKQQFSNLFNQGVRSIKEGNIALQLRRLAITCFFTAWQSVCNLKNCQSGAKATGTWPCNRDVPLASPFVKELLPRYKERAQSHQEYISKTININGKLLTADDNLRELNEELIKRGAPDYCLIHEGIVYEEAIAMIAAINENNSLLLSPFPKFIDKEGKVMKI